MTRGALAAVALVLALGGCISVNTEDTPPDFHTMLALRAQLPRAVATQRFSLARAELGNSVNIRGSTLHPPKGMTFGDVLQQALDTQLRSAGKLDPAATAAIGGQLTDNTAGENIAHGHAVIGADVFVERGGTRVFARHYAVTSAWDSSFIGAIAIPEAFNRYDGLYSDLARKILNDPDLIAALAEVTPRPS